MAIIVVAALSIAAIALRDRLAPSAAPAPPSAGAAAATPGAPPSVRATATANVYAWPDRRADVTAIVPGGSEASLHGRSDDGEWLLIAFPAGGAARGWARAVALGVGADAIAALPVASATAVPGAASRDARALPDLVLTEALLLRGGRLAVGLRNLGAAPVSDVTIALHVSTLAGELIGVLRIGPTTLAPGGAATVVTPLEIGVPGSYRLELDPANEIAESQDGNNTLHALLVPSGS